jgi:hypothetical protein
MYFALFSVEHDDNPLHFIDVVAAEDGVAAEEALLGMRPNVKSVIAYESYELRQMADQLDRLNDGSIDISQCSFDCRLSRIEVDN